MVEMNHNMFQFKMTNNILVVTIKILLNPKLFITWPLQWLMLDNKDSIKP